MSQDIRCTHQETKQLKLFWSTRWIPWQLGIFRVSINGCGIWFVTAQDSNLIGSGSSELDAQCAQTYSYPSRHFQQMMWVHAGSVVFIECSSYWFTSGAKVAHVITSWQRWLRSAFEECPILHGICNSILAKSTMFSWYPASPVSVLSAVLSVTTALRFVDVKMPVLCGNQHLALFGTLSPNRL